MENLQKKRWKKNHNYKQTLYIANVENFAYFQNGKLTFFIGFLFAKPYHNLSNRVKLYQDLTNHITKLNKIKNHITIFQTVSNHITICQIV
jgi:hypothetical protein